ncbi:MAG: PD-(D/E)XK nuclease family transposase [Firmicutes bacterium]|nr:PD-(D/E)XK nuclease family transposase [Bacillota bacterium]
MITKEMNKHVLSLKNDVLFKRVYGSDTEESKFILKSLLNKILGRDDDPIVHIEYKNPFSIKECVDEKESVLDIKAETNKRELIDI